MTQQQSLYTSQKSIPNTLIIVDDSALNRAILHEIFKDTYKIEEAENGMECLEMILDHKEEICAVLLDIVMPVMNGMELLKILRTQRLTEQIPVFFITAEGSDQVLKEGYNMGVMDIISKPVIPYIVQKRVNSVVELFRARRQLNNVVEEQQNEILIQKQKIIELNIGMIEALSTAIEFRSGEAGAHVLRIHDITKAMLKHTKLGKGLTNEQIELIAMASIMHDVGKIAVPDAILDKPGKLTKEEYEQIKLHTIQGAKLLERIPQMRNHEAYQYAYDIARHHHERWDGNGYPDGLKGNEISVWSQIVSVADVYDALVSKRVYKDAFQAEKAVKMIVEGECGVFSPILLECFLSIEKELRLLYEEKDRGEHCEQGKIKTGWD